MFSAGQELNVSVLLDLQALKLQYYRKVTSIRPSKQVTNLASNSGNSRRVTSSSRDSFSIYRWYFLAAHFGY